MINPADVRLIIFDMDGTIVSSLNAVYEAIKRAFAKLGWPVNFTEEDIRPFFGLPSNSGRQLHQFITPARSHLSWIEVGEKVLAEYDATFREYAHLFPGVKETLKILRERGYRLALYSNSSVSYFNTVTLALNMRELFDYLECVQENNLTKTELVKKIRDKFGDLVAAVVGDRIHDVEAARGSGSFFVGVLYGYGGKEPEQSDITIKSFDKLLTIFNKKL